MPKHWIEKEMKLIREFYLTPNGINILMDLLDKPYDQIVSKANGMNLNRTRAGLGRDHHFKSPSLPRFELLKTLICPGNGNGYCGKELSMESVFNDSGTVDHIAFDLKCIVGHRFHF